MNLPGFIGPSYTSISRSINAQACVNLRLEIDQANGKVPLALVGLPGYRSVVVDLPAVELRGFWTAAGRCFYVAGPVLYELFADMTHAVRGTLTTETGQVKAADNGLHMLVVDGVSVIALKLATNETTSDISGFPYGASFIVCVDNTFLADQPASQRFQISAVGDALTWRAIDFASAESMPDNISAVVSLNRQVHVLGTNSSQVFWNSGDALRPFIPIEGASCEIGCIAPWSAAKDETGVYWLGQDPRGASRIYKAAAGVPGVISTPALDILLKTYTLADATGYTFRMDGHVFYVLTFPTEDQTWLYDATTEAWSEFNEWSSAAWHRHRSNCSIFAFGRQLIGDFENGRIYELASDCYSNDGAVLRAVRSSAHVHKDQEMMVIGSFEAVAETGVGIPYGQGSDPEMMLRTSKDGGFTWTPEMRRSIGKQGVYRGRARWNRPCGAARDLVFEVSISDPVKRVLLQAIVNG